MNIAFFGYQGSFDYHNIGGTNSMIRRLSDEIINHSYNKKVDYILYGKNTCEIQHNKKFFSRYFSCLNDALRALKMYDHVIFIYIPFYDVFPIKKFILQNKKRIFFHILYQEWPESFLKRQLKFEFGKLLSINGRSFTISYRLFNSVKNWDEHAKFIFPPIPHNFFIPLSEKKFSNKIRVTFIGRIDHGKGVPDTIKLFKKLALLNEIELSFYGTHWENDPSAVTLYDYLIKQKLFKFVPVPFSQWSPDTDLMVQSALRETDIFLQPYQKLSSTLDTPLLLLESMASLCPVITKPLGNIPEIYPSSRCLIDKDNFFKKVEPLIISAHEWLYDEWTLIDRQNKILNPDTKSVSEIFLQAIQEVDKG